MSSLQRCRHLSLSGARCTMPAQYNKEFCFNHNHRRFMARSRPILPSTSDLRVPLVTFVYMEDMQSVMENINSIAQAFALSNIDHRQVSSLTYLMNTALKTLDRLKHIQALSKEDMAQQVVYDDLDMPMAAPDPQPCHAGSASADEVPAVAAPESAGCPTLAAPAFGASRAGMKPAEEAPCASDCHAESAPAGEASAVVPGAPNPSAEEPRAAEHEEEPLLTLQASAESGHESVLLNAGRYTLSTCASNHIRQGPLPTTPFSYTCENAIPQASCIQHLQFHRGGTQRGSGA